MATVVVIQAREKEGPDTHTTCWSYQTRVSNAIAAQPNHETANGRVGDVGVGCRARFCLRLQLLWHWAMPLWIASPYASNRRTVEGSEA